MSGWDSISGGTHNQDPIDADAFQKFLNRIRGLEEEPTDEYVDPDDLYVYAQNSSNRSIYTFLYEPKIGLVHRDGDVNHHTLLRDLDAEYDRRVGNYPISPVDPDDLAMFFHIDKLFTAFSSNYDLFAKKALVGRAGPSQTVMNAEEGSVVCFWNNNPEVYDQLLDDCVDQLYEQGLIETPVMISTPVQGTYPYKAAPATRTPSVDPQQLEKMRQLHLMRGDEKKKAMQELGLATQSQKHPMQAAMEKTGYIQPGQKWWAPTSENMFRTKLNQILREHFLW